ncbi:MAG TPA: sigma-54 dependent transcriptional regulator, partial [Candidatus Krumholzibacterium sp.]|nr:sigma-54 dependent transcriptional regulator [Candidatus Krumholzibacterium sp.]
MTLELDLISYNDSSRSTISRDCEESGWTVRQYVSLSDFLENPDENGSPVVILSIPEEWRDTDEEERILAFSRWKTANSDSQLIMFIPDNVPGSERLSVRLAARHTLRMPYESNDLTGILSNIAQGLGRRRQMDEVSRRQAPSEGFEEIVGVSEKMSAVIELARKVSESEYSSVMITGENGTGKGALAKAIHQASDRSDGPFIEVNCAAIPRNLLESEFFGYEKGAFTDAKARKMGLFELANGGTIFLDEIGEIDYGLQAKLLKFLDSRTIRRVSGTQFLPVDVRIISATNRRLKEEIGSNRFRIDLFYRLNVIEIDLPPLRERIEDIEPIAKIYAKKFSERMKKPTVTIAQDAVKLLESYSWPGNIRELINMLERAVLLNTSGTIYASDLPITFTEKETAVNIAEHDGTISIDMPEEGISLDRIERGVITTVLSMTGGNVTRAADLLKVERGTLRYKMKKHGIDAKSFKENPK